MSEFNLFNENQPFIPVSNSNQAYSGPGVLYVPDEADNIAILQAEVDILQVQILGTITSVGAIDPIANANGASVTSQVLHLHEATSTTGGVLSNNTQTIAGAKTMTKTLTLVENLIIPSSTATTGVIKIQGTNERIVTTLPTENIMVGQNAGNLTMTGPRNSFYGSNAGRYATTSEDCTVVGAYAGSLLQDATFCSFFGETSGANITNETRVCCIDSQGLAGINYAIHIGRPEHTSFYCPAIKNATAMTGSTLVTDTLTGKVGISSTSHIVSFAPVGAVPNANGASVTANVITLQPADGTNPGILTSIAQTIGGNKTLTGTITASNLSGTNTGNVTLSAVGAVPNANGATLTGQALNLQPADGTNPGVMTTVAQTFAGDKTFTGQILPNNIYLPHTASFTVGGINLGGTRQLHNYSSAGAKQNIFLGPLSGNYTNSATGCVGVGNNSLLALTSGIDNVAVGNNALTALTSGTSNTCIGPTAGLALTTGGSNLFAGSQAGSLITTTGNNVMFANTGTLGDANKIKIGNSSHTGGTSIFGISGATSAGGIAVLVNASGVLGTTTSSRRYKNTIADVPDSKVSNLFNLKVKSFYYNDDNAHEYLNYGLIAEEVEPYYPELVAYKEIDGVRVPETVYYQYLAPLLLKELQVMRKELDVAKSSIASLQLQLNLPPIGL